MKYKKILVTGSSGFLGSHIVDILNQKDCEVVLFDAKPSPFKKPNQKEIIGDILNLSDITKALDGCDAVFHFAAQADIDTSTSDPSQTILQNIIGTDNLLSLSVKMNVKRFVFSSTIYVYSNLGSFYKASKQRPFLAKKSFVLLQTGAEDKTLTFLSFSTCFIFSAISNKR